MNKKISEFHTPVLLLIFNRPNETRRVFEEIRKIKPSVFYVAADGPRSEYPEDAYLCDEARAIVDEVNWKCELRTCFREKNLGCMRAVIESITWFYENEEKGIILEDDCIPNASFFSFCSEALEEFKNNPRVWHICGNNFAATSSIFDGIGYSFSPLCQVWGWATWADRWGKAEFNPWCLGEFAEKTWSNWKLSKGAIKVKLFHLDCVKWQNHTWDYLWQVNVLCHDGLGIYPRENLISNVGVGEDATHTKSLQTDRNFLPTSESDFDFSLPEVTINQELTKWLEIKMGLRNPTIYMTTGTLPWMRQIKANLFKPLKKILRRIMLKEATPLILIVAPHIGCGESILRDKIVKDMVEDARKPQFSGLEKIISAILYLGPADGQSVDFRASGVAIRYGFPPKENPPPSTKVVYLSNHFDPVKFCQEIDDCENVSGSSVYRLITNGQYAEREDNETDEIILQAWLDLPGIDLLVLKNNDVRNPTSALNIGG